MQDLGRGEGKLVVASGHLLNGRSVQNLGLEEELWIEREVSLTLQEHVRCCARRGWGLGSRLCRRTRSVKFDMLSSNTHRAEVPSPGWENEGRRPRRVETSARRQSWDRRFAHLDSGSLQEERLGTLRVIKSSMTDSRACYARREVSRRYRGRRRRSSRLRNVSDPTLYMPPDR